MAPHSGLLHVFEALPFFPLCRFPFPLSPLFSYYLHFLYFLWAISIPFRLFDTTLIRVLIVRGHMALLRHSWVKAAGQGAKEGFTFGEPLSPNPCLQTLLNDWIRRFQSLTALTGNLLGYFGKAFLLWVQCHLCCDSLCFFHCRELFLLRSMWAFLSCALQNPDFCNFVMPCDNLKFAAPNTVLS